MIKTEHAGPKRGGSGFYGHHEIAKAVTKRLRRAFDKREAVDHEGPEQRAAEARLAAYESGDGSETDSR